MTQCSLNEGGSRGKTPPLRKGSIGVGSMSVTALSCPRCGWKGLVAPSPAQPELAHSRRVALIQRHVRGAHKLEHQAAVSLLEAIAKGEA